MDSAKCTSDLQIVLLGAKGTGKSATGNNILMKNVFKVDNSSKLVTSDCKKDTAEINGRHVTVIDTPGLFNNEITNEEIHKKIKNYFSKSPKPDVFLSVTSVGNFNKDHHREVVKLIQDTFGENAMENSMVLFTNVETLKDRTIKQYLLDKQSTIHKCVDQYGYGYHQFNNTQTKYSSQVLDLLDKIDKRVAESQMCSQKLESEKKEDLEKREERKNDPKTKEQLVMDKEKQYQKLIRDDKCNENITQYKREMKRKETNVDKDKHKRKKQNTEHSTETSNKKLQDNNNALQYLKTNEAREEIFMERGKESMNVNNEQEPTMYKVSKTGEPERCRQIAKKTPILHDKKEERKGNETDEAEMKIQSSTGEMEENDKKTQKGKKDQNKDTEREHKIRMKEKNEQEPTTCEVSKTGEPERCRQIAKKTPILHDKKEERKGNEIDEAEMKKDDDRMKIQSSTGKIEENDKKTQEGKMDQNKDTEREHKISMKEKNEQEPTTCEVSKTGEPERCRQIAKKTPILHDKKEERMGNETDEAEMKKDDDRMKIQSSTGKTEENDKKTQERRKDQNKDTEREHKISMKEKNEQEPTTCEVSKTGEPERCRQIAKKTPILHDKKEERKGNEIDEAEMKKDDDRMKIQSSTGKIEENDKKTQEGKMDQNKDTEREHKISMKEKNEQEPTTCEVSKTGEPERCRQIAKKTPILHDKKEERKGNETDEAEMKKDDDRMKIQSSTGKTEENDKKTQEGKMDQNKDTEREHKISMKEKNEQEPTTCEVSKTGEPERCRQIAKKTPILHDKKEERMGNETDEAEMKKDDDRMKIQSSTGKTEENDKKTQERRKDQNKDTEREHKISMKEKNEQEPTTSEVSKTGEPERCRQIAKKTPILHDKKEERKGNETDEAEMKKDDDRMKIQSSTGKTEENDKKTQERRKDQNKDTEREHKISMKEKNEQEPTTSEVSKTGEPERCRQIAKKTPILHDKKEERMGNETDEAEMKKDDDRMKIQSSTGKTEENDKKTQERRKDQNKDTEREHKISMKEKNEQEPTTCEVSKTGEPERCRQIAKKTPILHDKKEERKGNETDEAEMKKDDDRMKIQSSTGEMEENDKKTQEGKKDQNKDTEREHKISMKEKNEQEPTTSEVSKTGEPERCRQIAKKTPILHDKKEERKGNETDEAEMKKDDDRMKIQSSTGKTEENDKKTQERRKDQNKDTEREHKISMKEKNEQEPTTCEVSKTGEPERCRQIAKKTPILHDKKEERKGNETDEAEIKKDDDRMKIQSSTGKTEENDKKTQERRKDQNKDTEREHKIRMKEKNEQEPTTCEVSKTGEPERCRQIAKKTPILHDKKEERKGNEIDEAEMKKDDDRMKIQSSTGKTEENDKKTQEGKMDQNKDTEREHKISMKEKNEQEPTTCEVSKTGEPERCRQIAKKTPILHDKKEERKGNEIDEAEMKKDDDRMKIQSSTGKTEENDKKTQEGKMDQNKDTEREHKISMKEKNEQEPTTCEVSKTGEPERCRQIAKKTPILHDKKEERKGNETDEAEMKKDDDRMKIQSSTGEMEENDKKTQEGKKDQNKDTEREHKISMKEKNEQEPTTSEVSKTGEPERCRQIAKKTPILHDKKEERKGNETDEAEMKKDDDRMKIQSSTGKTEENDKKTQERRKDQNKDTEREHKIRMKEKNEQEPTTCEVSKTGEPERCRQIAKETPILHDKKEERKGNETDEAEMKKDDDRMKIQSSTGKTEENDKKKQEGKMDQNKDTEREHKISMKEKNEQEPTTCEVSKTGEPERCRQIAKKTPILHDKKEERMGNETDEAEMKKDDDRMKIQSSTGKTEENDKKTQERRKDQNKDTEREHKISMKEKNEQEPTTCEVSKTGEPERCRQIAKKTPILHDKKEERKGNETDEAEMKKDDDRMKIQSSTGEMEENDKKTQEGKKDQNKDTEREHKISMKEKNEQEPTTSEVSKTGEPERCRQIAKKTPILHDKKEERKGNETDEAEMKKDDDRMKIQSSTGKTEENDKKTQERRKDQNKNTEREHKISMKEKNEQEPTTCEVSKTGEPERCRQIAKKTPILHDKKEERKGNETDEAEMKKDDDRMKIQSSTGEMEENDKKTQEGKKDQNKDTEREHKISMKEKNEQEPTTSEVSKTGEPERCRQIAKKTPILHDKKEERKGNETDEAEMKKDDDRMKIQSSTGKTEENDKKTQERRKDQNKDEREHKISMKEKNEQEPTTCEVSKTGEPERRRQIAKKTPILHDKKEERKGNETDEAEIKKDDDRMKIQSSTGKTEENDKKTQERRKDQNKDTEREHKIRMKEKNEQEPTTCEVSKTGEPERCRQIAKKTPILHDKKEERKGNEIDEAEMKKDDDRMKIQSSTGKTEENDKKTQEGKKDQNKDTEREHKISMKEKNEQEPTTSEVSKTGEPERCRQIAKKTPILHDKKEERKGNETDEAEMKKDDDRMKIQSSTGKTEENDKKTQERRKDQNKDTEREHKIRMKEKNEQEPTTCEVSKTGEPERCRQIAKETPILHDKKEERKGNEIDEAEMKKDDDRMKIQSSTGKTEENDKKTQEGKMDQNKDTEREHKISMKEKNEQEPTTCEVSKTGEPERCRQIAKKTPILHDKKEERMGNETDEAEMKKDDDRMKIQSSTGKTEENDKKTQERRKDQNKDTEREHKISMKEKNEQEPTTCEVSKTGEPERCRQIAKKTPILHDKKEERKGNETDEAEMKKDDDRMKIQSSTGEMEENDKKTQEGKKDQNKDTEREHKISMKEKNEQEPTTSEVSKTGEPERCRQIAKKTPILHDKKEERKGNETDEAEIKKDDDRMKIQSSTGKTEENDKKTQEGKMDQNKDTEREHKISMKEKNEQEPTTCEVSKTGEPERCRQIAKKTPILHDKKEERKGNETDEAEMKKDDDRMKIQSSTGEMEENDKKTQEGKKDQNKDTEREHKISMKEKNEQEPTTSEVSKTGEPERCRQIAKKTPILHDKKEERKGNETDEAEMKKDDDRMKIQSSTGKTEENDKKTQEGKMDQNKDTEREHKISMKEKNEQEPTTCEVSKTGEPERCRQIAKKTPILHDKKEERKGNETDEAEMKKDDDRMKIQSSTGKTEENDKKTQERRKDQNKDTEREHKISMKEKNEQEPTTCEVSKTGEPERCRQIAKKTPILHDKKEERKGNETDEAEMKKDDDRMKIQSSTGKTEENDKKTQERRKDQNKNTEREHKIRMKEKNEQEPTTCEVSKTGEPERCRQIAKKTPILHDKKEERKGNETDEAEMKKDDDRMKIQSSTGKTEENDKKTQEGKKDQNNERESKESVKQQEFNRENEPHTIMYNRLKIERLENEENWNEKLKNVNKQLKMNEEQNEDRSNSITTMTTCYPDRDSSVQREENTQKSKQHESVENEQITNLFNRLNLKNSHLDKLTTADILQLAKFSLHWQEPQDETELVYAFLRKLMRINYMARYTSIKHKEKYYQINCTNEEKGHKIDETSYKCENQSEIDFKIHPMDVQMAVFHCADSFLKQLMVTKLSQCQYALPLLVPDPFTQQLEFPLWTFRQINKSWSVKNNEIITKTQPVCKAATPMVAFFRFGLVSSSKSQLMNNLINEKHNTFFHRNCKGSSTTRVLMDGVVEIAWYCPSGKDTDTFTDCVAFCNLHGDAGANEKQLNILAEMASVNVVLLPQLDRNDKNATKIQKIYKDSKTVICLLDKNNSALTEMRKGKYKIGLKDRNQSEVIEKLVRAINDGLSLSSTRSCSVFRLEDVARFSEIRVDEHDHDDCRIGKEKAQQMMSLLEKTDLTQIKELLLPCQGKLWHQWCQKNKELHRPQGDKTEIDISRKKTDLEKIRKQQQASDTSEFIKLFLKEMNTLNADEKVFFLKWLGILLDERTSEVLSALRFKYNIKCSEILKLKKNNGKPEQMAAEQTELKKISEDLHSANFGLVHILREIGQIYESCSSVKKNKDGLQCYFTYLPSLAAEVMISGFPLELMDGDASHVSLIWVTAVFDELVKKLGNLRVFVLSVLGIQSTGKSTLLNTMFGLQFAVSAGRCTRGAFMQLVKVSDEMKTQLKFDYILVVDTEGLCSLELSGRETRDHDNELATFVAGLGNLTLINVFGESLAEMQNILQIVVHTFLRMKQVKLNPSCIFVHQNVSDITAKEKNMEGKRKLLEELDEMTELAAKDDVCEVQCFKDVIKFDALDDVKYCAQLWEGNPPMAPPNPDYSENVKDLKETIFFHASQSDGIMLTQLKQHMQDLCEALLNERFVFSFKNSLEVANYRKLETEYSKWSWNLKNSMKEIENKLLIKIENGLINTIKDNDFEDQFKEMSEVNKYMSEFFKKHKNASMLFQWKAFEIKIKELQESIVSKSKRKLNEVLKQRDINKKINDQRTHYENIIFENSKQLALTLKDTLKDKKILEEKFDSSWKMWVNDIRKDAPALTDTDTDLYFERKKEEYYNIFQKYCEGATSCAIFGEFICNKLKEPIQQSVYKKTARDLANEMRSNCESLNGNRSKLEKHILKVLAEKENFDMYVIYIHKPRDLVEAFIRDEVSKYISEKFSVSVLQKIKEGIKLHQQKIIEAAHEASKLVKVKNDVDSWLNHFTNQLSDVLMLSEKIFTGVSHNDVDINLLVDVMRRELPSVKFDTSRTFRVVDFLDRLDYKHRPDEILIDHLCQCCWVQCPFCKAICTNTVKNHGGDHSIPFHRNIGLNGWHFRGTTNLSVDICTSEVASYHSFSPNASDTIAIPWREYRKGGPKYANWSITPDFSELPYWKWVVCRFQKDLENKYNKRFQGSGKIPDEWRKYTKQEAIESLNKHY